MKRKFYSVFFNCEKCGKELVILEVGVNSMSFVSFRLVCATCGTETNKEGELCRLVAYARLMEDKDLTIVEGNNLIN